MAQIPYMNWMGDQPTGSAYDVYQYYLGGGGPGGTTPTSGGTGIMQAYQPTCDGGGGTGGNAFGYGWILIVVAFFRELLGSGTLYGYPVFEKLGLYNYGYENNGMMILPPMALITVGIIIWIQRIKNEKLIEPK